MNARVDSLKGVAGDLQAGIELRLGSILTQKTVLKALAVAYFLVSFVIPWYARWQNYPITVYLAMIGITFIPVCIVINDKRNPRWVDWAVGVAAIALVAEPLYALVKANAELVFSDTLLLTTNNVQGYALPALAIIMLVAAHFSSEPDKRQGKQNSTKKSE